MSNPPPGGRSLGDTMSLHMASDRSGPRALIAFLIAIASREAFRLLPPPLAEVAWKLAWIALCSGSLWLGYGFGPRGVARELGLGSQALRGLGIAFVGTAPMALVLLASSGGVVRFGAQTLALRVLLAAFAEELLFRGFLFRQLHRRAGWRFATAVAVTGLLFGLAHAGSVVRGGASEVVGVVAVTTLGGAYFAWLLVRWNDDLWLPIGVHLFMNAWWELFGASASALGGTVENLARAAAVAGTVALTLRFTASAGVAAQHPPSR